MKVILQKDIPNLGDAGDIKEVADGYARNYLIPKKLVLLANESSKKAMDHQNRLIKIKKEKRKKVSEVVADKMQGLAVEIDVQVGAEGKLFGSVTSIDIARKLKEVGFEIDKRKISLENPIKQVGEYNIPVKLDEGITAQVKVTVGGEVIIEETPEVPEAPEAPEAEASAAETVEETPAEEEKEEISAEETKTEE
jgi:large subunit ribosomal protein L9